MTTINEFRSQLSGVTNKNFTTVQYNYSFQETTFSTTLDDFFFQAQTNGTVGSLLRYQQNGVLQLLNFNDPLHSIRAMTAIGINIIISTRSGG